MRIKRQILQKLRQHLNRKEITLITGPRQAGKTTLLKELMLKAQQDGKKTLFLDLDFEEDMYHFQSQLALINKIQLENLGQPTLKVILGLYSKIWFLLSYSGE